LVRRAGSEARAVPTLPPYGRDKTAALDLAAHRAPIGDAPLAAHRRWPTVISVAVHRPPAALPAIGALTWHAQKSMSRQTGQRQHTYRGFRFQLGACRAAQL